LLTDEYQSAEAIAEQIDDPEVTKAKVVARLTQLVKAGVADKEQVKAEDGRKIMNYKLASESVDAE
jgi:predicted transcriptional regulator